MENRASMTWTAWIPRPVQRILWGWTVSARTRDRLTFIGAHLMFAVAAVTFGIVFWAINHQVIGGAGTEHNPAIKDGALEFWKYVGIAVTFYASLAGTYDFVTRQAQRTERWFRGLSIVLLALSVLLCLFAMAVQRSSTQGLRELHLTAVIAVLAVFVVWDIFARQYYKSRSMFWFNEYSKILAIDVLIFLAFVLSSRFTHMSTKADADLRDSIEGALLCLLLFMELIFYVYFSFSQARELRKSERPLPVEDGYDKVASFYDRGNAIMAVESEHTRDRLTSLIPAGGAVLDLGCGTGRHIEQIAGSARTVTALDQSEGMLRVLRARVKDKPNVQICQSDVGLLPDTIKPDSIDLITCCLVIDHLNQYQLAAAVKEAARVLKPGGKLYITDVNGYFELIEKSHARFIDENGRLQTIRVYPHTLMETMTVLRRAGLEVEMREAAVSEEVVARHDELHALKGFPLIIEFLCTKPGAVSVRTENDRAFDVPRAS